MTRAGAVLVALLVGSAFTGGAHRPDLVVTAVSFSSHGRSLLVTATVRNRGEATAGASTIAYYLGRRPIGSRRMHSLAAGTVARTSTTLTIPNSVPSGSWRLRACVDARRRVRESNERGNCRNAARMVVIGDVTPPRFGGLERATTCVPGPVGGTTRYTPYHLQWQPASDDVTPSSAIVYDVYEAHTAGGEDFSKPTYTTQRGATSLATPPLPDNVSHYFVVRAVDAAGNHDRNKVERLGANLCL